MPRTTSDIKNILLICTGSDCKKKGVKALRKTSRKCLKDLGRTNSTLVVETKCKGLCKEGPVACLQPSNVWLCGASRKSITRLLETHLG